MAQNQASFFARGDSGSANNPNINARNTNQVPVTELTFVRHGPNGDLTLDFNDGQPDPDTRVIVGNQTYTFTLRFSGTIPATAKYANIGGVDFRGAQAVVLTVNGLPNGRFFFFPQLRPSAAAMAAFPNGATSLTPNNTPLNVTTPVPLLCFAAGTRIAVPGPGGRAATRPVEALAPGTRVLTDDGRAVPVRWAGRFIISRRALAADPARGPVAIEAGALGEGLPRRRLLLSPQHRVLVAGAAVERLFGLPRALVAARHLVGAPGVAPLQVAGPVRYHHLLLDAHEILMAEGLPCESLNPRDLALGAAGVAGRAEILRLFPRLADGAGFPMAAPVLRAPEGRVLADDLRRAAYSGGMSPIARAA